MDASLRAGFTVFVNVRDLGGGAVGGSDDEGPGDGFNRNWLHTMAGTLGAEVTFGVVASDREARNREIADQKARRTSSPQRGGIEQPMQYQPGRWPLHGDDICARSNRRSRRFETPSPRSSAPRGPQTARPRGPAAGDRERLRRTRVGRCVRELCTCSLAS